jgi:hypothetical protein
MIGIGATLFKRMAGGSRFSPSSLFSSGEQGVWYDPSDLTTMFQDDTSAAPAVIGQPVGTMLDKSQGLKLGSEVITNGDFAADSDWTKGTGWSIAGGVAVADDVTSQNLRQNGVALEENKVYSVTFTIVSISQGTVLGRFGGTPAVDSVAFDTAGTYTFFLRANATNSSFMLRGQSGFTGTVDNVSVEEVLGNHAIQTTSVNRPVLARHPEGGIRNLLSYTQEFDDDYWTKSASVTANQATAPDGTTTADEITFPVQYSNVRAPDLITTAGVTATVSVWLKNVDGNTALRLRGSTSGGTYLQNITITNEWARYTGTFTHDGTNDIGFALQDNNASNLGSVLIWGAQVELGSTATQYQHVTDDSRYDITEPFGANSLNYLKFDGVDDGLSITGLTSTSTPLTAWFGYSATNMENTSTSIYLLDIELGRTVLGKPNSVNTLGYYDGAWSTFTPSSGTNALKVLTYDLVEDNAKIRVDGTQEYSDATYDQQAIGGDIALFARYNFELTNYLAGNLYSCILRAAESTDKEISSTESYVAKKTGISL